MRPEFNLRDIRHSIEGIREIADSLRSQHWPSETIPVDVELMAEQMGFDIEPIAGLKASCGITACLCPDLRTISMDQETILDARQEFYLRFSLAHEIGHWALHKPFFEWQRAQGLKTVNEWIVFVRECDANLLPFAVEKDADEFAGRLLVPRERLKELLDEEIAKAKTPDLGSVCDDAVRDYLAARIHRQFQVNAQVISIRLRLEALYPPSR